MTTSQVPRKLRTGFKTRFPGSICPEQLLTIPGLAPGRCPRPEHSVLLCPCHTLSHTRTLRRGGAHTSPRALAVPHRLSTRVRGPGLWLLAFLEHRDQSCVWKLYRSPHSVSLHSPSPSPRVPLPTLTCPITQPSAHSWGWEEFPCILCLLSQGFLPPRLSCWGLLMAARPPALSRAEHLCGWEGVICVIRGAWSLP